MFHAEWGQAAFVTGLVEPGGVPVRACVRARARGRVCIQCIGCAPRDVVRRRFALRPQSDVLERLCWLACLLATQPRQRRNDLFPAVPACLRRERDYVAADIADLRAALHARRMHAIRSAIDEKPRPL